MKIKEEFEDWAHDKGMCLDQIFMSTDGVPENPYENSDTKLAFEIWVESAKRMDKITRHACAENVTTSDDKFYFDNGCGDDGEKDAEDAIIISDAHRIIMNTNAFKEEL